MSKKLPDIITEEELVKLLAEVKSKKHALSYLLGFYECMRISEIVGLGKEMSSCCKADITKVKTKVDGRSKMEYSCSKCNKKLTVADIRRSKTVNDILPLTLENVDMDRNLIILKGAKGDKDRNIPIAPEVRKQLKHLPVDVCARALEIAFKRKAKTVLNKDLHFHCLRHSGATHYLNKKKWNIRIVQQFLGHSNINTTQIYTHVSAEDMINAMYGGN